jgi:formyl-CoA transferase
MKVIGREDLVDHPDWRTPADRLPRLDQCFAMVEEWTKTKTKFEVMEILNPVNVPCGPILSMKDLAEEASLRETGTVVEVDHPTRGPYLTVGNPIKLSDSPAEVKRSPLLGEHTDEVLKEVIGYSDQEIAAAHEEGAI